MQYQRCVRIDREARPELLSFQVSVNSLVQTPGAYRLWRLTDFITYDLAYVPYIRVAFYLAS